MKDRLALLAAALWWGSLTTVGFLVVPMLFANLATPATAGAMAAKLFSAQTWVTLGCAFLLIIHIRTTAEGALEGKAQTDLMLVVAGALLALLVEYAVAPRIVARENLKLWHSVGTGMYAVQWLCATALIWRKGRTPA
ncbi:DUF4149 domain-containing protein [Variovorax sp. VNK109]|uniref:DUF4149 domain-containing protein n=1 Tax=Variovorax sp. VNK109 TaxID=3400919 RepID=UPI003C0987D0